jgi:hypothetical protein
MLSFLVPVLFTVYIQVVLNFKCKTPVPKVKRRICNYACRNFIQYMYHTKSHNAPMGFAKQLQMVYTDISTHLICSVGMSQ